MRPIALMYHRINTLRPDPWTTCVSPQHFAEHLEVIRSFPGQITITFDDGYGDNFEIAKPLLEKHDMPATIFVVSGSVGSPYEMWWDELERKYLAATPSNWDWDDPDPDPGATEYRLAFARYRQQPFSIAYPRPQARPNRRMMTAEEIVAIARGGLITIGAHTVTHPVLSNLPIEAQRHEIAQSKRDLEAIVDREVTLFAYPNGQPSDYTAETMALVREAGFTAAYAAWQRSNTDHPGPYELPRVMIRDWNGDVFASELRKTSSEAES